MALAQDTWWTQGNWNLFELCQRSLLAVAAVAIVSAAALAQYQRRKYPPGPSRLSAFLGMGLFTQDILDYKKSWKQQFGRIYTLFVGQMKAVTMTEYGVINDAFVRQADACSSRPSAADSAVKSLSVANCVAMVVQLFVAGTDTTASTLLWAWLFMILHPEMQQQVQSEIDRSVGSRPPSLNDRARLPLTEAVLTEVLRLANTAVSSLPHLTDADVNIGGYVVPKGTILLASLSDVHLDENTYPNPTRFDPQRFLSSSGAFEKPKKFIPFSVGRRACPGESLARAELFLFFTSVLQHFKLFAPEGCDFWEKGKTGLTHKPLPYQIIFQCRA